MQKNRQKRVRRGTKKQKISSDSDSDNNMKLRLRHNVRAENVYNVNCTLSDCQRQKISQTPFKYLIKLPAKTDLCCPLLLELVSRWDAASVGFKINNRVIPFRPFDVLLILGLSIVAKPVTIGGDQEIEVNKLFGDKPMDIKNVLSMLQEDKYKEDGEVDNFTRLYILLAFDTFYFPNTSDHIHKDFIHLVDDLESIGEYSWGSAVYEFCVSSLNIAEKTLRQAKNGSVLHLKGCATVLQTWALEYVPIISSLGNNVESYFPRMLRWGPVKLRRDKLRDCLTNNRAWEDFAASPEEEQIALVQEALEAIRPANVIAYRTDLESRVSKLESKNKMLRERVKILEGVIAQSPFTSIVATVKVFAAEEMMRLSHKKQAQLRK